MSTKTKKIFLFFFVTIVSFALSGIAHAEAGVSVSQSVTQQAIARPLVLLLVLGGLSLIPFVVMMTTAFVKIAVVLALIRNAMGTQQIPPNPIVTGLAMILTVYIMIPVGMQIYETAGDAIKKGSNQPVLSEASVSILLEGVNKAKEPVRAFLLKHAHAKERTLFFSLARKMQAEKNKDK
ncbi:MAG: EscR/YscR/HrcR family type III secretion system export apparatus protein, partial [Candidatus Altiarchaeota archaeon]